MDKILKIGNGEVLIQTDEPVLLVQIAIGLWFLSIPVSLIVGGFNMWSDIGVEGTTVFIVPTLILGLMVLDGTPCKKKWIDK